MGKQRRKACSLAGEHGDVWGHTLCSTRACSAQAHELRLPTHAVPAEPTKEAASWARSPRLSGAGATHTLLCSLGIVCTGLCCPGCTFRCSSLPVPVSLPEVDNLSVEVSADSGICFLWFDWLSPGCVGCLVSQLVWGALRCKKYEKCEIRPNFQTIISLGRQGLQASITGWMEPSENLGCARKINGQKITLKKKIHSSRGED